MAIKLDACSAIHLGDRAEQQDRVALFPHISRSGSMMAVLADGMGGHSGGAMAAEQVILAAKQNFSNFAPASESPEEFLTGIINDAHTTIKLTRFTSEQDPHSTAVVFMVHQGQVHWAHCGDSRLYVFDQGKFVGVTTDHSYVNDLLAKKRITPKQALVHPQRNLLLSCLGSASPPRIDFKGNHILKEGNAFVLCSDGLWGYLSEEEIGQAVSVFDARQAADVLINTARERGQGCGDNISLAIIKVDVASAE